MGGGVAQSMEMKLEDSFLSNESTSGGAWACAVLSLTPDPDTWFRAGKGSCAAGLK